MAGEKGGSGGPPTAAPQALHPRLGRATAHRAGLSPRDLAVVGVAAGLAVAVGAAAAAHPGHRASVGRVTSLAAVGDVVGVTTLITAVAVLAFLAVSLWPGRDRGLTVDEEEPLPWWKRLLAHVVVGVVAAALLAGGYWLISRSGKPPGTRRAPLLGGPGAGRRPHLGPSNGTPVAFGSWQVVLAGAGAVAALAFLWWALSRARRRAGASRDESGGGPGGLPAAGLVEDALAALRAERDPRRAVIRAYAAMEALLARSGRPKRPGETPFEHIGRSLEEAGAPRRAALRLTDLFEQARFSDHVLDAAIRRDAIDALEEVRAQGVSPA